MEFTYYSTASWIIGVVLVIGGRPAVTEVVIVLATTGVRCNANCITLVGMVIT